MRGKRWKVTPEKWLVHLNKNVCQSSMADWTSLLQVSEPDRFLLVKTNVGDSIDIEF